MSDLSDTIETFRIIDAHRKALRARYGIECPECKRLLPKACPKILLPGDYCGKNGHKYRDPRPELTEADHQAIENQM